MSHAQPHSIRHARSPRAHRDPVPVHAPRHTWRTHAHKAASTDSDFASAQMVFYMARGLAVLLAAVAVGLGAASDEAEQSSAAYPASSRATTR